jgi:hypothetical protein
MRRAAAGDTIMTTVPGGLAVAVADILGPA